MQALFKQIRRLLGPIFGILLVVLPTQVLAAVEAIVTADRAVVWADMQRSAPLGYIAKDKIIKVGEVLRNKNQVVPVVISGKIGYISVDDISYGESKETVPEARKYERFKEQTRKKEGHQLIFLVTGFSANESEDTTAGRTGEQWNFIGGSLKGSAPTATKRVSVIVMGDYLYAQHDPETFRIFEISMGLSYILIDAKYFKLKVEAAGTAVPWVQYESEPLFTLNGYGLGAIGQGVLDIYFNDEWGFEVSGGLQSLKLFGIDRPKPFKDFSPLFSGTRYSAGLLYRF